MRIAISPVVLIGDHSREATLLWRNSTATDTDRDVAATIERIDRIRQRGTLVMIFCDCHGNQTTMSTTLQSMNDAHCKDVIAVVADVCIKDERGGTRLSKRDC